MTNPANAHNNRRPLESGHRYAPRRMESRHVAQNHSTTTSSGAISQQPAQAAAAAKPMRTRSAVKPAGPRQSRSLVLKRKGLGAPKAAVVAPVVEVPVAQPVVQTRQYSRFHPANAHPALVFASAAVLTIGLVFGGGVLLFKSKKEAVDKYTLGTSKAETLGATTSEPNTKTDVNEIAPSSAEMAAYRTPSEEPRYLKIPKMQVNARVLAMDAGQNGLPSIPQNIYDAGWLTSSAKPGTHGVTLLNGQVVGTTKSGVFDVLDSLAVGDAVQIERGDGKTITYKVAKIDTYDQTQITPDVALAPADSRKSGLNLVAANGRFNVKTNTFEKRVIVRAIQQ